MDMQKLLLTFFNCGEVDSYPRFTTIAVAVAIAFGTIYLMGAETLSMLTLGAIVISIFEINKYQERVEEESRYRITIDTAIGIWIAILVSYNNLEHISYPYALQTYILFIVVSYYLIESWKPSTIGWIYDNFKGGSGIIGSSSLAGFASGFLTIVILYTVNSLIG
ncbi:Phosphatidylglycerophosphatase A [hydrothermal vent metagenome]|uniref:Phosphatidylglycerophosphatase A n=1 Tax=hydrothermal vent metagenome TaxID=652676 RepID=A0A1W1BB74_9ZZZZ